MRWVPVALSFKIDRLDTYKGRLYNLNINIWIKHWLDKARTTSEHTGSPRTRVNWPHFNGIWSRNCATYPDFPCGIIILCLLCLSISRYSNIKSTSGQPWYFHGADVDLSFTVYGLSWSKLSDLIISPIIWVHLDTWSSPQDVLARSLCKIIGLTGK